MLRVLLQFSLLGSLLLTLSCSSILSGFSSKQQQADIPLNNYKRAELFLPRNLEKRIKNTFLKPHWIGNGHSFWFRVERVEPVKSDTISQEVPFSDTVSLAESENEQSSKREESDIVGNGFDYFIYNEYSDQVTSAFSQQKLAVWLSKETSTHVAENHLPITVLSFDLVKQTFEFRFEKKKYSCDLNIDACSLLKEEHEKKLVSAKNSTKLSSIVNTSPNNVWGVAVRSDNLILKQHDTAKEYQLTSDGETLFGYGLGNDNPEENFKVSEDDFMPSVIGEWSKDSRYFATFKLDNRSVGSLSLTQSVTGKSKRPRVVTYIYPQAGDEKIPEGHFVIVDTKTKTAKTINLPPTLQTYYGSPIWGWFEDNNHFYLIQSDRGSKTFRAIEYEPMKQKWRVLIEETSKTFINPWAQDFWWLEQSKEFIWTSERDGYQHLYLYDGVTGKLKNKITDGDYYVRDVKNIDQKNRVVYFEASGESLNTTDKENDDPMKSDPYFRHLFRVNFDGSGLTQLTKEPANHFTQLSPDRKMFIDTYSRVDLAPVSLLKNSSDGSTHSQLLLADISGLKQIGWNPPEAFSVLAGDNKTLNYGIIFKPSNFDPSKSYPVIDSIYTGPHSFFTPKGFWTFHMHAYALAELGFIVIKMDGRGTSKRHRQYHHYSYKNLGGGIDDHVIGLKALAKKRPYMDIDRVGIYGFSAGGYDTAHALFKYPDFFKVGVAASGNHDFRVDKTGWNEVWMGYPVDQSWDDNSNLTWAKHLKGKLLLAHGELDSNVHPAATLQLADALMKANKDFDLMIYPNMGHVLHENDYFVRTRWDYFVRHLLNVEPPKQYRIGASESR